VHYSTSPDLPFTSHVLLPHSLTPRVLTLLPSHFVFSSLPLLDRLSAS
jgi:hypothetical protein